MESEQPQAIEEKLPYDIEKYKQCFTQCKKEYPDLDDYFAHLIVVHYLMGNKEIDLNKGREIQETYFKGDTYEGISSPASEQKNISE